MKFIQDLIKDSGYGYINPGGEKAKLRQNIGGSIFSPEDEETELQDIQDVEAPLEAKQKLLTPEASPSKTAPSLPSDPNQKPLSETKFHKDWVTEAMKREFKRYFMEKVYKKFVLTSWIFLLVYSQIAWTYSLIGCEYDIILCIIWLRTKFVKIIFWVVVYASIHFGIIVNAFFIKSLKMKIFGLATTFLSLLYRYSSSKGFSPTDYSQANFTLCCAVLIFLVVIFFWWYFTIKWFLEAKHRAKRKKISIWGAFWTTAWLYFLITRIFSSCSHLQDSFDRGSTYSNLDGDCKWSKGNICWHYTVDGIFRPLYWWGRGDCANFPTDLSLHKRM